MGDPGEKDAQIIANGVTEPCSTWNTCPPGRRPGPYRGPAKSRRAGRARQRPLRAAAAGDPDPARRRVIHKQQRHRPGPRPPRPARPGPESGPPPPASADRGTRVSRADARRTVTARSARWGPRVVSHLQVPIPGQASPVPPPRCAPAAQPGCDSDLDRRRPASRSPSLRQVSQSALDVLAAAASTSSPAVDQVLHPRPSSGSGRSVS